MELVTHLAYQLGSVWQAEIASGGYARVGYIPPMPYRTHMIGELAYEKPPAPVQVAGWVQGVRDHGGLLFVDLRDRDGIIQLVVHPTSAAYQLAGSLPRESVISARGQLVAREPGTENPDIASGSIEIQVAGIDLLGSAKTPPFTPVDEGVDEALRLAYRYLDLRKPRLQNNLAVRHQVMQAMRHVLDMRDFCEVETPILTRSTPEGARDFLVPARNTPGEFYALPQSPQLFKQLLMVAGLERYYQIARCFRDEAVRADRQPEFTQLDVELSFCDEDEVISLTEAVMAQVFVATGYEVSAPPYPRISYAESMARFGVDRPDIRFAMEITDISELVADSPFRVFQNTLRSGGVVRGLVASSAGERFPRAAYDQMTELVKEAGAGGLVWANITPNGWKGPVAKVVPALEQAAINQQLGAVVGDTVFIVADTEEVCATALGRLRLELAERLEIDRPGHAPVWVVEFPMFAYNQEANRWQAEHHPFTRPIGDLADPGSVSSAAYDLVLDGQEIGGGSLRIHDTDQQQAVLEVLGMEAAEAEERFGFLLQALQYGAPPHGGIALGIDRIASIICGEDSIREVIAFPKTSTGQDPLTGAPAEVDEKQLRELGLSLRANKPKTS